MSRPNSKANESDGMQVDWWDSLSQDERNNYMNSFSQVNNTYPVDGTIYMDNYDEMDSSNQYYVKNLFTFVRDDMDNDLLGRNHNILEEVHEGLIDNIWGLLVNSSRMQFLDEYMGDMNIPLMITMGSMSMPQTNEEVADALGVSKSEALKFISKWAYDNGITDTVYTEAKASEFNIGTTMICPICNKEIETGNEDSFYYKSSFYDANSVPMSYKMQNHFEQEHTPEDFGVQNKNFKGASGGYEAFEDWKTGNQLSLAFRNSFPEYNQDDAIMMAKPSSDDTLDSDGNRMPDEWYIEQWKKKNGITESKAGEAISDSDKQILSDWVSQNTDWTTIDDLPENIFIPLMAPFGDDIDKRVEAQVEIINYMKSLGESNVGAESWSQKSSIERIEALEKLGIKQGDAIKLSGLEFEDFGEDLQGALKDDDEDKEEHGEVENPNIEFQQYYPDYNNIGESQTTRTKYECEYCDHGFKSNEALSIHHNDKHAIAPESLDGYASEADCTNCGQSGVDPDPRFQLGSWCEDCQDRLELAKDNWWKNATDEEKRKENEWNDKPWESEFDGESKANEADPDFQNDPDFQGYTKDEFGNKVKSHPSQYTASGWDQEKKERMNARGDVDGSEFYASEHNVGDYVTMTDDALDNYGQQYRGQSFRISHVAKSVDDHMGYDEGMGGENLYDLDGFNSSLYDYEVESANESKASEVISEDEKDEIFQYLFDLQESGATNMFGSGAYVERDFPHLDKREVGDVITEWMANWDEIATRMGIESYATENPTSDGYSWSADQDEISRIQFQTNLTKEEKNREIQKIEKRQQEQEDLELEADTPRNRTGYFESKASEGYVVFDKNDVTIERHDEEWEAEVQADSIGGYVQKEETSGGDLGGIIYDARESKETEHDDLSSGHQISDRYTNNYIRFLQRWKQEHPDWKQNVDKTLSNFVKYMVKMGYNKRNAEMVWNDYLYSPESKANEVKCKNCQGKGWYLGDLNPNVSNDYGEIECEYCNGTGKDPKFGDESKASEANISKVLREYGVDMEEAQRIADGIGVNVQGLVDSDNFYYYLQEYRAELSSIMRDADAEFANYTDKDYEKFGLRKNSKGDWYDPKKTSESKATEAGLEDHSCPECGFITSDNSDYVDHLNAHEE